jgi:hypothetical protein
MPKYGQIKMAMIQRGHRIMSTQMSLVKKRKKLSVKSPYGKINMAIGNHLSIPLVKDIVVLCRMVARQADDLLRIIFIRY